MNSAALVPLAVPVVTALVGAVGILLRDTGARRNRDAVRARAFRDAREQVEFVNVWLLATRSTKPSSDVLQAADDQANLWLQQAAASLTNALVVQPDPEKSRNIVVRLFLTYEMRSRTAKILRVVFYLLLAVLGFGAVALASAATSSLSSDRSLIGSDVVILGLVGLITLILGFAATHAEATAVRAQQAPEATAVRAQQAPKTGDVLRSSPNARLPGSTAETL
jgi:hypothetical protein